MDKMSPVNSVIKNLEDAILGEVASNKIQNALQASTFLMTNIPLAIEAEIDEKDEAVKIMLQYRIYDKFEAFLSNLFKPKTALN